MPAGIFTVPVVISHTKTFFLQGEGEKGSSNKKKRKEVCSKRLLHPSWTHRAKGWLLVPVEDEDDGGEGLAQSGGR